MLRISAYSKRLLHPVADGVVVVLGLDDRDRNIRLVVEDVVSELGLAPRDHLASDVDLTLGEVDLPPQSECCSFQPESSTAGVMNFAQMSASLRSFLLIGPAPAWARSCSRYRAHPTYSVYFGMSCGAHEAKGSCEARD